MSEDYTVKGHTYKIPSDGDTADAHEAFKVFADSMPRVSAVRKGSPEAPVLSADLTFTEPASGAAGPIFGYGVVVKPDKAQNVSGQDVHVSATVDSATKQIQVSGTVPFHDYTFTVYAVNAAGAGLESNKITMQFNYNEVTGGTFTDLVDPVDGKKYRVQTFATTQDVNIVSSPNPYWLLLVGGGFDGGHGDSGQYGGGGGGVTENKSARLPSGPVTITVGAKNGGSSSIGTHFTAEGAKGGNGVPGAGGGAGAANGGIGAEGQWSEITGTREGYAGGGSSVNWNYCCDPCCFGGNRNQTGGGAGHDCGTRDAWRPGGGGGRTQHTCGASGVGMDGIVILRYEIA